MKQVINVEGMKCMGCATTVKNTMSEINGVSEVEVNLEEKTATVTADKEINEKDLATAFAGTKYKFS